MERRHNILAQGMYLIPPPPTFFFYFPSISPPCLVERAREFLLLFSNLSFLALFDHFLPWYLVYFPFY